MTNTLKPILNFPEETNYLKLILTYTKNVAKERGISKARVFFCAHFYTHFFLLNG